MTVPPCVPQNYKSTALQNFYEDMVKQSMEIVVYYTLSCVPYAYWVLVDNIANMGSTTNTKKTLEKIRSVGIPYLNSIFLELTVLKTTELVNIVPVESGTECSDTHTKQVKFISLSFNFAAFDN